MLTAHWCLHDYGFYGKAQVQVSMCELLRYHDAKFIIGFSKILCVSDELLRAIGA